MTTYFSGKTLFSLNFLNGGTMGILSALKAVGTAVENAGTFIDDMRMGHRIGRLILLDRASAMLTLEEIVKACTPQQLDEFEVKFLGASMGMFNPDQRIRSMELYAYLKRLETARHGWRGFAASTEGGALT